MADTEKPFYWKRDYEKGISVKNVYLITAMFPNTKREFWLKLQKNYDKTVARLNKENELCGCEADEFGIEHKKSAH
jgi:plasmid maintenance system antidote protein VapI